MFAKKVFNLLAISDGSENETPSIIKQEGGSEADLPMFAAFFRSCHDFFKFD